MSLKLPNELFPSIIIFLAALTTSIITYSTISLEASGARTFVSGISEGEKDFAVLHKGACIGKISSSLSSQNSILVMHASGTVNIAIGQNLFSPNLELQATFNSIGQLGGSLLKLSIDNSFISIGSSGIDPMNVKLRTKIDTSETQKNFSISGPVEMKRGNDGKYSVEYAQLSQMREHSDSLFGPALSFLSEISLKEDTTLGERCSEVGQSKLDLSAQVNFLAVLASQLSPLIDQKVN